MVNILSIPSYDGEINSAIEIILRKYDQEEKKNLIITATGAHGLVTSKRDTFFKEILSKSYLNLPDGMPLVWVGRLKGSKEMKRCYGPDFFREVIISTKNKKIKHFFFGGKEGVAKKLKNVCEEKYGNKNIVGIYSPPFREMNEEEIKIIAKEINNQKADIIWIGLSTPKQEVFAYRLKEYTKAYFICTIGAAFDFHTGNLKQAPRWIQTAGMEWFFRLLIEPKRLWRRYINIIPMFIIYNLFEIIKGDFFNNKSKRC